MKNIIKKLLKEAVKKTYPDQDFSSLLEIQNVTAKNIQADYFTNISMKLAKILKTNPIEIADKIIGNMNNIDDIKFNIVKPGYINFSVGDGKKNNIISIINKSENLLSDCKTADPKKINIEFISANPTGPLHVGHGRGAIYGNIISKFLKIQGHHTVKEYYVNDYGNQIKKLIESILSKIDDNHIKIEEDDLYQGDYIETVAKTIEEEIKKKDIKDFNAQRSIILDEMFKIINVPINNLNIIFDKWFYESSLFDENLVEKVIKKLEATDHTFRDDGALMLKADEPRVLIKSNGDYTYFATDLAYHDLKMKDYDRIIDVWGADHHGYVPRIKAGLRALGHNIDKLDVHLIQFANLFRDGKKVSMSTRKGDFVELEDLRNEIGNDAINFFYLTKNKDQHLDFDLSIAISQNKNNPVYYIQYAYARIEKILNEVKDYHKEEYDLSSLDNIYEKDIITTLSNFHETIKKSIIGLQPHLVTNYLLKLSQDFHSYYANVKILNKDINYGQVHLIAAVQKVIKCGLDLINIDTPKEM